MKIPFFNAARPLSFPAWSVLYLLAISTGAALALGVLHLIYMAVSPDLLAGLKRPFWLAYPGAYLLTFGLGGPILGLVALARRKSQPAPRKPASGSKPDGRGAANPELAGTPFA